MAKATFPNEHKDQLKRAKNSLGILATNRSSSSPCMGRHRRGHTSSPVRQVILKKTTVEMHNQAEKGSEVDNQLLSGCQVEMSLTWTSAKEAASVWSICAKWPKRAKNFAYRFSAEVPPRDTSPDS